MTDEILKAIYYDPSHPAAFGGLATLARASNLKPKAVKAWLRGQATYTLHKPARIRYIVRKYRVSGIDHQWQSDICDMQAYAKNNDGFKYILTIINIISRYARSWARKTT